MHWPCPEGFWLRRAPRRARSSADADGARPRGLCRLLRRSQTSVQTPAWIHLRRHRHVLGTPGEIELIRATVARVTPARAALAVGAEFQRWQARQVTDLLRGDLVHRDAEMNVRARRFLGLAAGEEGSRGPRMIPSAIPVRSGPVVTQAGDDGEIISMLFDDLERLGQLISRSLARRHPFVHISPRWGCKGRPSALVACPAWPPRIHAASQTQAQAMRTVPSPQKTSAACGVRGEGCVVKFHD